MKKELHYFKQLFNETNKTKLIGLLAILILLWIILYAIPSLFFSLFHTFLGNSILLFTVLLISATYSTTYGILAAISIIILYQISHPSSNETRIKESFWTQDSTQTFLKIQDTINRNTNFDTSMIQEQASQEEVDYFNTNGKWPWSQTTQDLYIEASNQNPYVRSYPSDSMIHARTLYNQNAIQQILKTQTPEGRMLLNGVQINSGDPDLTGRGNFGYTSGLITNETNPKSKVIVCDAKTNQLKQKRFLGYGGILTEQVKEEIPFDYNDLESTVPGFQFTSGPCNPCANFDPQSNSTCNFSLNLTNQDSDSNSQTMWSRILDSKENEDFCSKFQ